LRIGLKLLSILLIVGMLVPAAAAATKAAAKKTATKTVAAKPKAAPRKLVAKKRAPARTVTRGAAVKRKGTRRRIVSHYALTKRNVDPNPHWSELPELTVPVTNLTQEELRDSFFHRRSGGRIHHAIDIFRPVGDPLYAVVDGTVEKLFRSRLGGVTLYLYDETRKFCFYYAHLSKYATGIQPGTRVKRGDLIGYVGNTGNARRTSPHLHFQIMKTETTESWWMNAGVLNPYPLLVSVVSRLQVQPQDVMVDEEYASGGDDLERN
jgi:murein DD-endopeptidase MepM/ murein hydrolase activator NlpD